MKIFISHLRGERLVIEPRSLASDNFQIYLKSSIDRVNKVEKDFDKHFGLSIAQTAHEALDLMTPGQRESLLTILRQMDIRVNLLNNMQTTTEIFIKEYKIVEGDEYSGNFQGSIFNIRSKLENVTQTINNFPKATDADKQELEKLVNELKKELATKPERAEDAEVVADQLETLLDKANKENTSKKSLEITGEGLKKAAENIYDVLPNVVNIATRVITLVLGLIP